MYNKLNFKAISSIEFIPYLGLCPCVSVLILAKPSLKLITKLLTYIISEILYKL